MQKEKCLFTNLAAVTLLTFIFSNVGIFKSFSQVKEANQVEQYATLYLYRPAYRTMRLNDYVVHVGDSVYKAKNGSKTFIHLYKEGNLEVWAKSEGRKSLEISVVYGNAYYIRCDIKAGILKGKPVFTLVDSLFGKNEYESITQR